MAELDYWHDTIMSADVTTKVMKALDGILADVYDYGTTDPISLFNAAGNPIGNPVASDASGYVEFGAAAGKYTVHLSDPNITPRMSPKDVVWSAVPAEMVDRVLRPGMMSPLPADDTQIPTGFLLCDGSAISRATYSALFAVIGVAWGPGNGTTTFNVPDFRGRTFVGEDGAAARLTANETLGAVGGEEKHIVTIDEMPGHQHPILQPTFQAPFIRRDITDFDVDSNEGRMWGHVVHSNPGGTGTMHVPVFFFDSATGGYTLDNRMDDGPGLTVSAGGFDPHNNMQPFGVGNWIIFTGVV